MSTLIRQKKIIPVPIIHDWNENAIQKEHPTSILALANISKAEKHAANELTA